ncbi:MAG TPA: SpoIIE family protein phosphatase [Vicinamibacteria bacterium]|nr:SpoIIE family protein phosphatase [Vicinamibacteria bacterium]
MAYLRLSSGNGPSEVFALGPDRVVLGRSRDCDLILPDVLLSRRHAEIVPGPHGWLLRDLGSLNGTRLNGVRVEREEALRDGDRIGMSDWSLVFHEAKAPSDPALAVAGARLRDVTELATRSDHEVGTLARQSRILGVLTRAAAAVVGTASTEVLLDTLLGHLLEAVPARRGLVALFAGDPPAPTLAAARAVEGSPPVAVDPAIAERLLRTQGAFLAPRVAADDGSVRSVLCAPLWFSGPPQEPERVAGCVVLEGPADPSPFGDEHLRLVTAVANLGASRLESLRLREETADKRRLEEDLKGAARIQESLLPEGAPTLPGWELAGSSRLCSAVGADYYDFAPAADGLLLALGDVAGKGLAAALLMASLRASVRALWREPDPLPEILTRVNENLRQTVPPNRFATLFLGRLDTGSGVLRWVNAGHSPPLVARSDGSHELLEATGTILGVLADVSWREGRTTLGPGDVLVLLSDGVVEAARSTSGDLSPDRLAAIVGDRRGASAAELLSALQAAAEEGLGGARRADDQTFVVLRRQPR